jgi:hypothetical protein
MDTDEHGFNYPLPHLVHQPPTINYFDAKEDEVKWPKMAYFLLQVCQTRVPSGVTGAREVEQDATLQKASPTSLHHTS